MELPDPMLPPQVDLRDFGFMPLDVLRLRDSDIATVATGDEFKAAVLLWCASWHQIPASSVPSDDRWLAKHSGAGPRWRRVKSEALRGFLLCNDGRMYHPVVAEKAAEGWNGKLEAEHKRACDRRRKENKDRQQQQLDPLPMPPRPDLLSVRNIDGVPRWRVWKSSGNSDGMKDNSNGNPTDGLRKSRLKGEGEVQGEVQGKDKPKTHDDLEPNGSPVDFIFRVGKKLLHDAGCKGDHGSILGKVRKSLGDIEAAALIAKMAATSPPISQPVEYLMAAIKPKEQRNVV